MFDDLSVDENQKTKADNTPLDLIQRTKGSLQKISEEPQKPKKVLKMRFEPYTQLI